MVIRKNYIKASHTACSARLASVACPGADGACPVRPVVCSGPFPAFDPPQATDIGYWWRSRTPLHRKPCSCAYGPISMLPINPTTCVLRSRSRSMVPGRRSLASGRMASVRLLPDPANRNWSPDFVPISFLRRQSMSFPGIVEACGRDALATGVACRYRAFELCGNRPSDPSGMVPPGGS